MRRQKGEPNRVELNPKRLSNLNGRGNDSSKALYYTLASSTVLEKNNFSGNTRELDNVFLAAAKYGDMDILLRTLDRHSININVRDETNGDTALLLAAKGNNSKVVEALVERGADVTLLNEDGKGALDLASNYLRLSVLSKYPKSPAHSAVAVIKAAWQGDIVSLKNILATHSGGNVLDNMTEEGLTPLLVVTRDINTFLRLQRSIRLSYDPTKCIQELLKHKANVNATDMEGHTALHFATRISAQKLCRDIVELLLLHRPVINILDRTNLAPLHTATNNDNVAVVAALVAAGANPNLHGIGGATPLHIGAQQENEDIIRKLVLAGGDVNALDSAGMTPLCVARSHKIRELMRSLFADLAADKGLEIKLKYDELMSKRKLQKMLEPPPPPPPEPKEKMDTGRPDYKPLQRALINDAYRNKYDYDVNKRVPRLVEGKRLDYNARRRSSDKSVVSLFPRIEPENPVLLLKRHMNSPIEVPIMQRQQSRLKPNGVFITQNSCQKSGLTDIPKTRPPIPKHTCGFVKPDRNGSDKTRKSDKESNASGGNNNKVPDNEQWLPGAPMILNGSDGSRSRPTSAVTGSSSQSFKGPKIHLKHVLRNILAASKGMHHENLLDRYVQQQRPIKVKEMGFVDFLLQDDDPDKVSEASSSIRSHNFSDSSSMSGQSMTSASAEPAAEPSATPETITASRISIGETTPEMPSVNLPKLRQFPAPAASQDQPLRASTKPVVERINGSVSKERRGSITKERRSSITRPHDLILRRNSNDDCRKMSVVNIASPYNSPSETPKISSRSSKDSGYGSLATSSLATLLNRPTEQETPEETAPKHVTAVVVSQESRGDVEKDGDSDSGSETEVEEDENVKSGEITLKKEAEEREASLPEVEKSVEVEEPEAMEEAGPIVGVNHNKVLQLQGQRIKSVPKLSNSNNRPNKFKELTFKKKVYSRRLPQIKEENRTLKRGDSAISRFKKRERRATRSAKSGTSESSGEKENTPNQNVSRPGTVPSKPVLGVNLPSKHKPRPKTSDSRSDKSSPQEPEDPDKISEDKITAELDQITRHDKNLLKRLSTMKDLDALVSTNPLQLVSKQIVEVIGEAPGDVRFNDNRSLWSDKKSVMTSFTGTTRIESIMGDTTQWKKGRLLGSGGGGKVWYGMTQEKIEVAVKQIELYGEHEEARDEYIELQEEVKLLKCLKHDNIIRYYGTCLQDNCVNIFMEYIDGGSLASRIKKLGSLPERTIQSYTFQLLDSLKYIHAKNIVHRDIKGQNILVTRDDQIKLIDFGCGKRLRRSMHNADALKTMRGTPYWMSPEVITGNGHGIKSDIWSLACTVFEMLSGHPPWHTLPTMAAIYKIGTGRLPAYPDNASDYCIDFMKACFIVDTKERPSAEELLKHEFIELYSNRLKN
ncbi:ankyrin repeat domain-containing protein 12-like isoform X2 [Bolinopsis microptera]|uniref:ankyrin repeat domain-containing protein 12-like isoform X2 n=1 Tax=Bolinopsis microptera TaxID=2820187 RepID=UPI0030796890